MSLAQEQINKDEIHSFLKNNNIDPRNAMGYNNKFGTRYYVGESRKFAEEATVGFDISDKSDINVSLHDINDIEFETGFKVTEHNFSYDETSEALTITGNNSKIHNEGYKVIIESVYLDL